MSLVNHIIQYKPDEWTSANYTSENFHLVELDPNTHEFTTLEAEFKLKKRKEVAEIKRIQHPYLYGMFLFQKAQLSRNNSHVEVSFQI